MWDDAFFDVESINEILPRLKIKMEHCLMFLRASGLLVPGPSFKRYCEKLAYAVHKTVGKSITHSALAEYHHSGQPGHRHP